MPPLRTMSLDKPVKTERTHEENQERAYIAASRRSDRSLEARIESARRASEIHKRRTGRSLRVTEADVINEEMYEEEDDDLPMQYRRLTAHLQTNSTDFNRRLAAYLSSQMAMRAALDQAVMNTYGSQSAATAAYLQNQQAVQQGIYSPPHLTSPQTPTAPFSYQNLQYPIQHNQSDISTTSRQPFTPIERSQSFVAHRPSMPAHQNSTDDIPVKSPAAGTEALRTPQPSNSLREASLPLQLPTSPVHDTGPLTSSLAPESIRLLTNPLDTSAAMNAGYFSDGEKLRQSYYPFQPPPSFNTSFQFHSTYDGMNQTLAPCALDSKTDGDDCFSPTSLNADEYVPQNDVSYNYDFDTANQDVTHALADLPADGDRDVFGDTDWAEYIDTSWE